MTNFSDSLKKPALRPVFSYYGSSLYISWHLPLVAQTLPGSLGSMALPSRRVSRQPASCRIRLPAAKSHGDRRHSKKISIRPAAT